MPEWIRDENGFPWTGQYVLGGKDGHEPIPCYNLLEWARWFEEADRRVAFTGNRKKWVSTVFLGLDHGWFGDGPPVVFETMVFVDNGDKWADGKPRYESIDQDRYSSWKAAEDGHKRMVEKHFIDPKARVQLGGEVGRMKLQHLGDLLEKAGESIDYHELDFSVEEARKMLDVLPDDAELGDLPEKIDQAQGDASSDGEPRFIVIKIHV